MLSGVQKLDAHEVQLFLDSGLRQDLNKRHISEFFFTLLGANLRVLIVTQYFWPENFRINDLAEGLRDKGHEVAVLTGKPNYPSGRFFAGYGFFKRSKDSYNGIPVTRVPMVPRGAGTALRLTVNYISFAFFASLLAPFRYREKPDAILVYEPSPITVGLPALVLKKIRGAPIFFWVQDLWPESLSATGMVRSAWVLRQVERLVRFIYKHCDRILVQSRAFVGPMTRLGVEVDRIEYFPNSAEELYQPMVAPDGAPKGVNLPNGFRVMFAGNIGAAQDFETILGAAEKLKSYPDIRWIVLGDGRMAAWVKEEINRRGLSEIVYLLGRYPVETMPRFFALSDALLVTLRKDPIFALTIPSKVQSYLACGRPIVAALNGEGARVIDEAGAGLSVPAEDAEQLAGAVLKLYIMPKAEREAMGAKGRVYYLENFERNLLIDRLDKLIRAVN
jgi:glycosyltransferase involved in cell wall biosynthesis